MAEAATQQHQAIASTSSDVPSTTHLTPAHTSVIQEQTLAPPLPAQSPLPPQGSIAAAVKTELNMSLKTEIDARPPPVPDQVTIEILINLGRLEPKLEVSKHPYLKLFLQSQLGISWGDQATPAPPPVSDQVGEWKRLNSSYHNSSIISPLCPHPRSPTTPITTAALSPTTSA